MASEKITNLVEEVKGLSVLELSELVKAIEEEFGVTAAVATAAAPAASDEAAAEGPSEVTLTLKSFGTAKVAVIKAIQSITGLGLMDAKKLVDAAPSVVKEKISPSEAEQYKKTLVDAGAEVEIK